MSKVIVLIGAPGSGKSTWAKENCENTKILSMDAIRKQLYGDEAIQGDGKRVFNIFYALCQRYLKQNYNIALDCTNCNIQNREWIFKLPADEFHAVFLNTPLAECIARDAKRNRTVGQAIIEKFYNKLQPPSDKENWTSITEIT